MAGDGATEQLLRFKSDLVGREGAIGCYQHRKDCLADGAESSSAFDVAAPFRLG